MEPNERAHLARQIARGRVILFTGAGFSNGAFTKNGAPVASVAELKEALWQLLFPGEPLDETATLGDLYEAGLRSKKTQLRSLLEDRLRVDPGRLPDVYETWFSMPWARAYTVNVDDLDEAVGRQFRLPRPVTSISAVRDGIAVPVGSLASVHLNGRLDDFPDSTFSARQYGERVAAIDPWYHQLVAELASHTVLFVGTSLDELPLWQYIALRRGKGRGKEFRPGSYLVTPTLSAPRRVSLGDFNVHWVQMTHHEFASEVLSTLGGEREQGLILVSQLQERHGARTLRRVADIRDEGASDLPGFLLGRQPTWRDLSEGFAIKRSFEEPMKSKFESAKKRLLLISGTAGSGKSTTLMRLGLDYEAQGREAYWLDLGTEWSPSEIRRRIKEREVDVVLIDDIDTFGSAGGQLLADLLSDNAETTVVAAARTTRIDHLGIEEHLEEDKVEQVTVPHLGDDDIEGLLAALDAANRLGRLKGKDHDQQVRVFKERAGRQLLVAMIEATSGERFEEKIERECEELTSEHRFVYGVVALATTQRVYLTKDEILLAVGESDNDALARIGDLLRQELLVDVNGEIVVRHRLIAERVVDYLQRQHEIAVPITGLMFAMSTKVHPGRPRHSREAKLLSRLISHDWLMSMIGVDEVREAYQEIEGQCSWDYHYWLQRGSVEVEVGALSDAQNFLEQARALAPDDYKVQTEWGYMALKKAVERAPSPESRELAEESFRELEGAINKRGAKDPHPYQVFGSQGLIWASKAGLKRDELKEVLARIWRISEEGARMHSKDGQLQQLAHEAEKAYLMLAVPPELREA